MKSTTLLPFLSVLTGLTSALTIPISHAANSSSAASNSTCTPPNAVHLIVARASTENPGLGILSAVATTVQQSLPGSDAEAVDYPATLTDYFNSEASGVTAMTGLVAAYAARCPESKMALMGYSQGAQVAGDVMCGRNEAGFNSTQPLPAALSKNIVAMMLMGDPTHVPNLPQDAGNSTRAGIFPRMNTACGNATAALTKSYCNADDRFCDNGTSIPVHLSYVKVFGADAAQFIVSKMNATMLAR